MPNYNNLDTDLCNFLKGKNTGYKHFNCDMKLAFSYMDFLWDVINPRGTILNMGIMKKTPRCLLKISQLKDITNILHIELDDSRKVRTSPKERVIWQKDFVKYARKAKRKGITFNGVTIWHGPEHLEKNKGIECIEDCIKISQDWVLVSCPWDRLEGWKQQPKNKEHLGHKSTWTEQDFLGLGFRVISFGERKIYPGYLIAWILIGDMS